MFCGFKLPTVFQQLWPELLFLFGGISWGGCLFKCSWFWEGCLFICFRNISSKKSYLLGCLCKKPKPYQKAACRMLSFGDHKSTALQRTELLIATAFSAALLFLKGQVLHQILHQVLCLPGCVSSLSIFRSRMKIVGAAEGWARVVLWNLALGELSSHGFICPG